MREEVASRSTSPAETGRHAAPPGPNVSGQPPGLTVRLDRLAKWALWAVVVILLLNCVPLMTHALMRGSTLDVTAVRFLYVDEETNLPTLLSVVLFLTSATAAAICSRLCRVRRSKGALAWAGIAVALAAAGADEFIQVHETLNYYLQQALPDDVDQAFPWPWVLAGVVVVVVLAAVFAPFILRLDRRVRRWMILGAALFFLGALGMEVVGGFISVDGPGEGTLLYQSLSTVEEALEFLGVIAVLHGLLVQIGQYLGNQRVELHGQL